MISLSEHPFIQRLAAQSLAIEACPRNTDWTQALLHLRPDLRVDVFGGNAELFAAKFADVISSGQMRLIPISLPSENAWPPAPPWAAFTGFSLDEYCSQQKIDRVGILRIHTEGNELAVLRGAVGLLRAERIDLLRMTSSRPVLGADSSLWDTAALLMPFGYTLLEILAGQLSRIPDFFTTHATRQADFELFIPSSKFPGVQLPAPAYPTSPNPIVSLASLGQMGQFGNQIFQYFFAWLLARHHGATLLTPPWRGQSLFGLRDAPVTGAMPRIFESKEFPECVFPTFLLNGSPVNADLWGYFQFDTIHYAPFRQQFQALFQPVPQLSPLAEAMRKLREPGRTIVGLHLRLLREANHHFYFPTPQSWTLEHLRRLWPKLRNPVLYISTDLEDFSIEPYQEFNPLTRRDLGLNIQWADFYPDFYALTQCDALCISNSTFSFVAAMLNQRAAAFFRPHLFRHAYIPFDPWSSMPLLHRELGTSLAWHRPQA